MRREVAAQIAALRTREEILNRQMGDLLQKNREVPAVELAMQRLQREAKNNDDLLALLKAKHQEALIKESEKIEEVSIVRPATEPDTPVGAEALNTVLVGALLGLSLGLVLAFVQETLDTSIGTIEDVEAYLEVPVLGVVPHIDARETVQRVLERRPALAQIDPEALLSHALLITHFDPKSPVAEAYRTLRTNVQFARMERAGKVLVVTSPTLQEGKTTTIVNLALTLAQSGQRTLLVGGNLRRPSIHRFFGIEREPGLSDILIGSTPWRDCIRTVADILMGRFEMEDIMAAPGLDNLHIIEAGPRPGQPLRAPVDARDGRVPPCRARRVRHCSDRYAARLAGHRLGDRRGAGRRRDPGLPGGKGRAPRPQARQGPHRERRRQGLGRGPQRRQDGDRRVRVHALLHPLLRRGNRHRYPQGASQSGGRVLPAAPRARGRSRDAWRARLGDRRRSGDWRIRGRPVRRDPAGADAPGDEQAPRAPHRPDRDPRGCARRGRGRLARRGAP